MTTTIHTARYNDQVFTRTSKSRTYSHVVLGRDSYELHLAGAQSKGWARTDASNYRWTVATAEGRAEYGWNRTPEAIAKAQAELQGINSVEEYQAAQTARRVADVEARKAAGGFDTYGVIGWTSRLDLAQKLQGQSQARYGHVVIVEAERTTKEPKGQPKAAEAPVATEEAAPAAPEAAEVADTPYQVAKLKSEGKHFEAGQMAARLSLHRSYGAHYGERSTRDAACVAFLAGYDAQVSHEDDSAFQDVLLAVVDQAATHEIEVTLEANQTTKRTPLTMELVKDILRRNGMLNDADRQGNKGLRRLWAALLEGDRIHTTFHSYKLVAIEPDEAAEYLEALRAAWPSYTFQVDTDTNKLVVRKHDVVVITQGLAKGWDLVVRNVREDLGDVVAPVELYDAEGSLWIAKKVSLGDRAWDIQRSWYNRSSVEPGVQSFYAASLEEAQARLGTPGGDEPVKTSQELLASTEDPTLGDMLGIALLADREAKAAQRDFSVAEVAEGFTKLTGQAIPVPPQVIDTLTGKEGQELDLIDDQDQDDDRVYDEHDQPLLVIERDDSGLLDIPEDHLPTTTVWLTRAILEKAASWAGHRRIGASLQALLDGKRIYNGTRSYVLAPEEDDEPQDGYKGDPGHPDTFQALFTERWAEEGVQEQPQAPARTIGGWMALYDASRRNAIRDISAPSWEQRLEAAQTPQETVAIAREVVRAARDAQVTQGELQGMTLVVSGAFVGTNGPRALTVDELHFMAACEGQSARQVLERLKAGQVIEGSCTHRYLAEAAQCAA